MSLVTIDSVKYTFSGTDATVSGYDNSTAPNSWNLVIPSTITYLGNVYNVVSIGQSAFENLLKLISVIIPSSVISIRDFAFLNCSRLTSVSLPSVTSIGRDSFRNSGLTSVIMPSVTSIGETAFQSCSSLTSVSMPFVTTISHGAFRFCTALTSVSMPAVSIIGWTVFKGCTSLRSITIPSSITSNGGDIFDLCSPLLIVNYNPTISDLPSDVTWREFSIKLNSTNAIIFEGYFVTINSTQFIKLMYTKQNLNTNILAPYTNNDYGYNSKWDNVNNKFGSGGTNIITSIPALDSLYNAAKWSLWDNILSYQDATTKNWIDLPSNAITYTFTQLNGQPTLPAIMYPMCFPAGTPVLTDQGSIAIEKINSSIHTIRNKNIVAITKTVTIEDKIVCIEKDALGLNIPSQKTYISRNHELLYNKQMLKAKNLIGVVDGVYNKKYNGEILYNVLLDKHDKMIVNNLIVETLDPENIVAKLYNGGYSVEEKNNIIINLNNGAKEYKKQFGKMR